ncbi:MAG: ion channel [Pseudomonadota bacterium]
MLKIMMVNGAILVLVILIHYEFLYQASRWMPALPMRHRGRILLGIFAAISAHLLEIWVFGIAYYLMDKRGTGWGQLVGEFDGELLSSVYFSFTAFTTLGIGDITPEGNIRFLVGLESLAGFVLITWTASFLYLEMTRHWDHLED